MMNAPWVRVFVFRQAPFFVDDHLNGDGTAQAVLGRRCDRLVIGIGVQRVAVVINRDQRLQRGADIVEVHFLRMQRATGCLDVIFEFLRAFVRTIFKAHGRRPDATGDPAHDGILRVHPVREKET